MDVASREDRYDGARWRWWAALAGLLAGFADAFFLQALGIRFAVNDHDATLLIGAYFGLSFAALGYLLGALAAARRRDRRSAALLQAQMETIHNARARLAQSEKLAALGQLAAQVAHEVRNPLAVIRSAAQGLAEGPAADDEARRACAFITAETDRLNNVVTSLLAFARPLQLQPRAVRLPELFERAALLSRDELGAKQIRLRCGDTDGLPPISGDADLVSQVLVGLLANGAEAAGPRGEISLNARAAEGSVQIEVADSGPGVPPELRERVFEPFFTTRARGTGLGLAIARQIIEAHGGRIEVAEGSGGGALFRIQLPAAPGAALAA